MEEASGDQTEEEDATTIGDDDATTFESTTDYESVEPYVNEDTVSADEARKRDDDIEETREQKERSWRERCVDRRWTREGESLWRIYMKSYAESQQKKAEKAAERKVSARDVPRLPRAEAIEEIFPPECFPLGGFRLEQQSRTPVGADRCKKTRIWRSMRTRQPTRTFRRRGEPSRMRRSGERQRSVWPCTTRDLAGELKARERAKRKKRRDILPCEPQDNDDDDDGLLREQRSDLANRKELGHVRAPVACPDTKLELLVDRAAGEHPGLVDGDYVIAEFACNGQDRRVYANVILRGLKGMHLPELSPLRQRRNTWKFCFYQAMVALLAKTQLRYKYAWSANIDYIYDHAWTLYTHIGAINVKRKQRFDDVVVYNYKYSIEIELIQEMRDVPVVARGVDCYYEEDGLKRRIVLRRKDPLRVRVELGCRKITNSARCAAVHEDLQKMEEWLDKLPTRYRNCIFRVARFSLAFWQDGLFWYLYNPYRCDEFGFWHDDGRACIAKFCSKDSLRRHLMILLLRAYACEVPRSEDPEDRVERDVFDVQIFHVTFHCCQLHNLKLLQRGAPLKASQRADECISESPDRGDTSGPEEEEEEEEDPKEPRERCTWLRCFRVTWCKCAPDAKRKRRSASSEAGKARWHHYYVEEANRLFSLWGEIHITDGMFDEANRGMQTYACYVVCAGMTRIMAPEYWSSKILDVIVMCGDRYYAHSKLEAERKSTKSEYAHVSCWSRYLCNRFKIGEIAFEAKMLPSVCGRLYAGSSGGCLWKTLERMFREYHFGILTCESVCLGLLKFCGAYYVCDVNSFGPPLFQYGHGATCLMRATSFRKFTIVLILTIGSPERSRFSVNPVEILRVVEVGPSRPMGIGEERRSRLGGEARAFGERKKARAERWKSRRN